MSVTKKTSHRSFSVLLVVAAVLVGTQAGLAQPNLILDPSFEGTPPGVWGEDSTQGFELITDVGFPDGVTPRTGSFLAWLGGGADELSQVFQTVEIPADAEGGTLSWYQWVLSEDFLAPDDAGFNVLIGGTSVFSQDLDPEDSTIGWVPQSVPVDLTPYAGSSVEVRFAAQTFDDFTSIFLDDASLQVSGTSGVPVIPAPPAAGLALLGLCLLRRWRCAGLR